MKQEFLNLATFDTRPDAETLKSLLLTEGIEAHVQDETKLQRFWFAATPKAGIHVQVSKEDFTKTQQILHDPRFSECLQRAVHCPSCNSSRVQYPDLTRKNILPTLLAQLFVLLGISKHKYYCEDCHFSWSGNTDITGNSDPRPATPNLSRH